MTSAGDNRFQDFFEDDQYVALKNHLYNYLLRKRAVEKVMQHEEKGVVLEIGSGLSPVLTSWDRVVYSDLSFLALKTLRQAHAKGHCIVADGMNLPFRADVFSHAISSEVLEHLADDRKALQEIVRVIKPDSCLVVTFPHRHFYFSKDDRFVNHYRRYELSEMASRLKEAGLHPVYVRKVLGPLEKVTMIMVTLSISIVQKCRFRKKTIYPSPDERGRMGWGKDMIESSRLPPPPEPSPNEGEGILDFSRSRQRLSRKERMEKQKLRPAGIIVSLFKWANRLYAGVAWIDAFIMPRTLSAVLLIKAVRKEGHEEMSQSHGARN